jgi:methylglutaconyl-CoA hydratase
LVPCNEPVSEENWKNSYGEMTLAAHEWKSADWAAAKGLYANTFETIEELDKQ